MTLEYETNAEPPAGVNGSSANGAKPSGGAPPSLEDFFITSEKGAPNILHDMITTSINPQEYIPRSHISKRQAAALQRLIVMVEIWTKREVDFGLIVWNNLAYSIATDGLGRSQAVDMYGGLGNRIKEGFMGLGLGSGQGEPRQRRG